MRAFGVYTLARVALFLGCWGLLWLVGAKSWLGAFLALIISGLLSYIVLDKLRSRLSSTMARGWQDIRRRFEAGKAAEDDDQQPTLR